MVAKTRLGVAHVLAEAKHHAELIGVHPEESGKSPDGDRGEKDRADPFGAEVTARQHGAQLVLAAAQKLFEIGRRWVLAPRAPRSAALIAPRHRMSPRSPPARRRACVSRVRRSPLGNTRARNSPSRPAPPAAFRSPCRPRPTPRPCRRSGSSPARAHPRFS